MMAAMGRFCSRAKSSNCCACSLCRPVSNTINPFGATMMMLLPSGWRFGVASPATRYVPGAISDAAEAHAPYSMPANARIRMNMDVPVLVRARRFVRMRILTGVDWDQQLEGSSSAYCTRPVFPSSPEPTVPVASSWTRMRCAPPAGLRASRHSSTSRRGGPQSLGLQSLVGRDRSAQRRGILGCAAFDAAKDAAAGIGDEDGRHVVHAKCSENLARCVQGERYGHFVLCSILAQVRGVRPQTGCDSEPAQAWICTQGTDLFAGAAAGRGNFRPCGREVGLAPRRQEDQHGQLALRGAVLQLETLPVEGSQGPFGQQIAHRYGRRIVVLSGGAVCTPAVGRAPRRDPRCARRHQGVIELLVGEMTDVAYPAIASDNDVRRCYPEMESRVQAAVVEYDGHGDPDLLAVVPDGLDGGVESDIDPDDGQIRSPRSIGVLEMRHLLPAAYAPICS